MRLACVLVIALAACGSDGSKKLDAAAQKDAPKGLDGLTVDSPMADAAIDAPQHVVAVSCTGITPAATVTIATSGVAYMPATTTIQQGQIVEFMTTATHDASPGHSTPDTTINDPGLHVGFNMTGCLMFASTGTASTARSSSNKYATFVSSGAERS